MMRQLFLITFLLGTAYTVLGQKDKVLRGFSELNAKNYGLALQIFQELKDKNSSISNYGMALLYGETLDFKQIDSAIFYANESIQSYAENLVHIPRKQRIALNDLGWNLNEMNRLLQGFYGKKFNELQQMNSIAAINQFLLLAKDYEHLDAVIDLRDSLFLLECGQNQLACLIQLKLMSPNSRFSNQIQEQIEELGYKRWVQHGEEEEFYTYTLYHPRSIYKPLAEDEIYQLYVTQNDTIAFKRFIQLYPKNKNLDKIWRAFYQLSAGNYDQNKMRDFIARYPMYPYAENVRAELERFGKELFPYASPDGLMGYMDEQGIAVIPAVYDWIGDFKEGLAVVMKESSYGVINKQGQLHLPIAFEFISDFHNGYAIFSQNSTFGVVNRAGIKVIDNQFSDLEWAFGDLLVYENDGKKGVMNMQGEFLSPLMFNEVNPVNEMLAIVTIDGLSGVINSSLMRVIPIAYEQLIQNEHGFMVVNRGLRGIFDPFGKVLLPVEFNEIGELSQGFRLLRKGNAFSHVNCTSWRIADYWYATFPEAMRWSKMINGQFLILKNKKYVFVDTLQRITKLFPLIQLNTMDLVLTGIKEKNGKFGFWERNGKELSPFQFDYVEPLKNGQYLVTLSGQHGIYSKTGQLVLPCIYDDIVLWNENNFYIVQKGSKKGIFTMDGKEILPLDFDWVKKYNAQCWMLKKEGELMYFFPTSAKWITLTRN